MWTIRRLCLLGLCPGILALAGCSGAGAADAAKARAEAEAAKAEVAQLKSELARVKSGLDQLKSELARRGQGGRLQFFMDAKGERAYLFDPEKGQVLTASLKSGTDNWVIAVRSSRDWSGKANGAPVMVSSAQSR